jgi:hypothetical protein
MADIELVIKIDEGIAQGIIDGENDEPRKIVRGFQATIADAIKNCTILPKGHGELITKEQAIRLVEFYQVNPQHFDFDTLIDEIKNEKPIYDPRKEKEEEEQER